jgi:hypothetical protein
VTKRCWACKETRPLSDFYASTKNRARDGLQSECKECCRQRRRRDYVYKPEDPAALRDRKLRQRYGITQVEFDMLLAAQGGCCAICPRDLTDVSPKSRHVDHDHETGAVRGVLCNGCNTTLGRIERVGLEPFRRYLAAKVI